MHGEFTIRFYYLTKSIHTTLSSLTSTCCDSSFTSLARWAQALKSVLEMGVKEMSAYLSDGSRAGVNELKDEPLRFR